VNLLAVFDGKPASVAALETAAVLAERLKAELGVVTVRSGTHATESLPPVGSDIPVHDRSHLPDGIRTLLGATDLLVETGFLKPLESITLRDLPHGHLFEAKRSTGEPVFFAERFGSLLDELNQAIEEHHHDLVVIAAPRRGALGRFAPMNTPRKLALDLHSSFLVVRGGTVDSRLLVCVDGSPSSRRIFPFLKGLLPAVGGRIDLLCAHREPPDPKDVEQADHCLQMAQEWLGRCGKQVTVSQPRGSKRYELIIEAAGRDAIIVMGESQMHDVRRRTLGTLPMKVMPRTDASFLMVKNPTAPDPEMFDESFACK
jgi:nucleotide-binding universal stress UspA family protein